MVKDSCPTSLDRYNPLGCAFNDTCPTSLDRYNPLGCAFNDTRPTSLDRYNSLDSWSVIRVILLVARLDGHLSTIPIPS